jgi:peptide-methionine (S)-S-oxide reductase
MTAVLFSWAGNSAAAQSTENEPAKTSIEKSTEATEMYAMFGAGCFWCVEAIFEELKGVTSVESGYAGGDSEGPTYQEVCSGDSGHAEVVRITYDPAQVPYEKLLEVFFRTHDPTTLNRQGPDHGSQYRSVIFYFDDTQKETAERIRAELDKSGAFKQPIVTEIVEAATFYPAEDYHQDYFRKNPDAGYCQYSIQPKIDKFKKVFADSLKTSDK